MSARPRPSALPGSHAHRTCSRWSCAQRIPAVGPDPTLLRTLMRRGVRDLANVASLDIERAEAPRPLAWYRQTFLEHLFAQAAELPGPAYPREQLVGAASHGVACLETLVERVLPRLKSQETLQMLNLPFVWSLPDVRGGFLKARGRLPRLGQDRLTGTLRIYDWRFAEPQAVDWQAVHRMQRIGVRLGWLQSRKPGAEIVHVEVYLPSDTAIESTWTPEQFRDLEALLRVQADCQDAAETVADTIFPSSMPELN